MYAVPTHPSPKHCIYHTLFQVPQVGSIFLSPPPLFPLFFHALPSFPSSFSPSPPSPDSPSTPAPPSPTIHRCRRLRCARPGPPSQSPASKLPLYPQLPLLFGRQLLLQSDGFPNGRSRGCHSSRCSRCGGRLLRPRTQALNMPGCRTWMKHLHIRQLPS